VEKLHAAHDALNAWRDEFAIAEICEIQDTPGGKSFLLCDLIEIGGKSPARETKSTRTAGT